MNRRQYVPLRRRYTAVDLEFLVKRITEADSELAEVAARRQLGHKAAAPRRLPRSQANAGDRSAFPVAPRHARHKRSVARARRLSLVILPITAALLVMSPFIFKAYKSDRTPQSQSQPQPPNQQSQTEVTPTTDLQTGLPRPTTVTTQPRRTTKSAHLAVDYGIDLDSEAPNWSYGRKSQSPFFLEAGRFGAAYGTEITKIDDSSTIDECRNATGFDPSVDLKLGI